MTPSPRQPEGGTPRMTTPAKPTVIKQGVHGRQYPKSDPIGRLNRGSK